MGKEEYSISYGYNSSKPSVLTPLVCSFCCLVYVIGLNLFNYIVWFQEFGTGISNPAFRDFPYYDVMNIITAFFWFFLRHREVQMPMLFAWMSTFINGEFRTALSIFKVYESLLSEEEYTDEYWKNLEMYMIQDMLLLLLKIAIFVIFVFFPKCYKSNDIETNKSYLDSGLTSKVERMYFTKWGADFVATCLVWFDFMIVVYGNFEWPIIIAFGFIWYRWIRECIENN
ncbi:hypothetical protein Kpol_1045p84 [Vanderwaltozyma polyspora DSM 70294]|uniref:Uncharacterized protein n=1 Tax=Vanderwaltozyma polyspora (strain ATCC 22028 / DSM 70294 / BCRC 21397 / CBS 2163 / NBRC 10782 / NRRL Y-8283 / UCD 57-17) TaxID=436907 RepID=A7TI90_VANPO|nr:uncharacterized protein Kpol_1045p84 [Vanderwaltozyma polyspora DSM 70294]EDO18097.1 hypothetical protein Kpol_1045p84 [Vanderwaltozyma polyspora DSM 70294]